MGAFLSEPVTEKISTDEKSSRLSYGASSMQGWRLTQEKSHRCIIKKKDAHNCLLNYDENTSFFAVYDGHGGAEVAKYCALHLPAFLRSLPQYKENDIVKGLEEAFIGFDEKLTKPEVITELKELAGTSLSESDDDDTKVLCEEAEMPLEELLARYKAGGVPLKVTPHLGHLQNDKPKSPMLRAKKDSEDENTQKESTESKDGEKNSNVLVNGENEIKYEKISEGKINEIKSKKKQDLSDFENNEDDKLSNVHQNCEIDEENLKTSETKTDISENTRKEKNDNKSKCVNKNADNLDDNIGKESTSNSSTGSRSRGPLLDLEDSDTSDDDYGESDSDSADKDEWKEDEEDEEEDDNDDDDDDDDEGEDKIDLSHDLFPVGEKEEPGSDSGCTAVVAIIHGSTLYVANAGDSRCVVSRNGKAIEMSSDHKPEDDLERMRIEKAGGQVTSDGRVNGGLNLSRAIGDHSYKQNTSLPPQEQMIIAVPEVRTLHLDSDEDDFVVLACDGIWNYMSSQEVVDFIRKRLKSTTKLSSVCEELFDHCLAPHTMGDGTGCDNMTCIIVKFHELDASNENVPLKRSHSPADNTLQQEKKIRTDEDSD